MPRLKKRLVLVSHGDLAGERKMSDTESLDEVATLDSHSARLHRVRERLQGPQDRRVRSAIDVITSIAARVGFLHDDQEIPRTIQRQQWSAFNIPLLWAAAELPCVVVVGATMP